MLIFWWMGRGYITALLTFATMMIFAILLQAMAPLIPDRQWYWGLSLIAASGINWKVGSHLNRKRLARIAKDNLRQRLFYKAPNRFMSVPMETFSIALLIAGTTLTVYGATYSGL